MNEARPIVVTGSIAIDRIMSFSGRYSDHIQPEKLAGMSVSLFLDSLKDTYGGVGANIAYSLSLLGDEPVLLGSVGHDGLLYMEQLAHHGVNITRVHESALPTATFTVFTDSDQNQIGGFYPGAMFDSDSLTLDAWKGSNAIVVVSPHDPKAMRRQVRECKTFSLSLCYDIGQQVSNLPGEEMAEGVDAAEILILNDYELGVLCSKTGRSAAAIKATVPLVITTFGKEGSVVEGKDMRRPTRIGIVPPRQVADPTGAGDAYRAGLLHGYARDWPIKACARLGAVCATYAIESVGTQNHTFTHKQAMKRYEQAFKERMVSRHG